MLLSEFQTTGFKRERPVLTSRSTFCTSVTASLH